MHWATYYSERIKEAGGAINYLAKKGAEKRDLLTLIETHTPTGGKILEIGCGTGATSVYLAQKGYDVTCVDIDKKMLAIARKLQHAAKTKIDIRHADIRTLPALKGFDVCFSQGVLEHFTDKDILRILKKQLSAATIVVVSVPTNYFSAHQRIHGDERFLPPLYWQGICKQAGARILQTKGYYYQEGGTLLPRIVQKVTLDIFPYKKPFYALLLTKNTSDTSASHQ